MEVTYKKHINKDKNNRIEFLLINWDYEDGGDYLAKIFCKEYGMLAEEKIDYIYYSVINLHMNKITYELLWHEDFGNIVYSVKQDMEAIDALEKKLKVVLKILNEKIKVNSDNVK